MQHYTFTVHSSTIMDRSVISHFLTVQSTGLDIKVSYLKHLGSLHSKLIAFLLRGAHPPPAEAIEIRDVWPRAVPHPLQEAPVVVLGGCIDLGQVRYDARRYLGEG